MENNTTTNDSVSNSTVTSASSAVSSGSSAKEEKPRPEPAFIFPEFRPTQKAGDTGVFFDFCCGARIVASDPLPRRIHCILTDCDTGTLLHSSELKPGHCVSCSKKFYMRYKLELFDEETKEELYEHVMDLKDREVLVQLPYRGALGDSLAWFSCIDSFAKKHQARVHVIMPPDIADLVKPSYPDIVFDSPEDTRLLMPYAEYFLGLYFKGDEDWQPYDFRLMSLHGTAAAILGMTDLKEAPPRLTIGPKPFDRQKPYVCIATHGSSHAKHWCAPGGWRCVVKYLNECGYDVVCIDKEYEVGSDDVWHSTPLGVVDDIGAKPLQERVDMIAHAAFFIGLSSGLSWLAWGCGVPVVLISGFTLPFCEFQTPYRVQCRHGCHGCWNDTRYEFDHHDFLWCPRYKGTSRACECTKLISPKMVIDTINRIPGVLPHRNN